MRQYERMHIFYSFTSDVTHKKLFHLTKQTIAVSKLRLCSINVLADGLPSIFFMLYAIDKKDCIFRNWLSKIRFNHILAASLFEPLELNLCTYFYFHITSIDWKDSNPFQHEYIFKTFSMLQFAWQ